MGSIYMVSETSKSQLKRFLGFIWNTSDSINIVGWPGGPLNPYFAFGMHFGGELGETQVLRPFEAM